MKETQKPSQFDRDNTKFKMIKLFLPFSILLLLTISIILLKFSSKNKQTLQNRAEEQQATNITSDVVEMKQRINDYRESADDNSYQEITSQTNDLRSKFMHILSADTSGSQKFLEIIEEYFPEEYINSLPENLKQSNLIVDYKKDLAGVLDITDNHDLRSGKHWNNYELTTDDKTNFQVYCFNYDCPNLPSSSARIVTNGISFEYENNSLLILRSQDEKSMQISQASEDEPLRKINVALVVNNYDLSPVDNETVNKIAAKIFPIEEPGTVANYLKTVSYGLTTVTGESVNPPVRPFQVKGYNDQPEHANCKLWGFSDLQTALFFRSYDIVISFTLGQQDSCAFASSDPASHRILLTGIKPEQSAVVIAHEIIHILMGNKKGHSYAIIYPNKTTNKTNQVLCDPYDILRVNVDCLNKSGEDWYFGHLNAYYKQLLGWSITTQTVEKDKIGLDSTNGIYPIASLEKPTNFIVPQLLKVKIPNTDKYYYLEYRQPIDYDEKTPLVVFKDYAKRDIAHGGVLIRVKYKVKNTEDLALISNPDINPPEENALVDGQSFYDYINNIRITQVKSDENVVKVKIEYDASPSPSTAP